MAFKRSGVRLPLPPPNLGDACPRAAARNRVEICERIHAMEYDVTGDAAGMPMDTALLDMTAQYADPVPMAVYIEHFLGLGVFLISFVLLFVFVVFHIRALCGIQKIQRGILAALETMNSTNAQMANALQGIRAAPATDGAATDAEDDDEDDTEGETPADFVYCPECSTRVEIDPSIRNINVVCPDCKKPFHIH